MSADAVALGPELQGGGGAWSSLPGFIFDLIFTFCRIIRVDNNMIFVFKYLIPQTCITTKTPIFYKQ